MRALKTVRLRLRSLLRGARVEHELSEELRDHLEREIERHATCGLAPAEARAAALRAFGNVALIEEQVRDARRVRWIEDLLRDVMFAVRSIRRAPGHTAVIALSFAAGIGANTTAFSLVNTLMLRDLPVVDPGSLVEIGRETSSGPGNLSYPMYERVRDENHTFRSVLAVSSPVVRAADDGSDQPPIGRYVSGNFFEALGVTAAVGRALTPADDRLDAVAVTVISHELWQRMFGGARDVVGRTLTIGGLPPNITPVPFTIVGVLPPAFHGLTVGRSDDFYVPMASEPRVSPRSLLRSASAGWLKVVGRLRPDTSRDAAMADVGLIYSRFVDEAAPFSSLTETRQRRAQRTTVGSARAGLSGPRGEFGRPVLLLMGAVALVLLVACANVVNLLLARGLARRAEIGIRLAIGAGRGRLIRQLLAESAVIGLIGGSLGLAFAWSATPRIATLMANEDPTITYDVAPDAAVLMFTLALSVGSAFAAGLIPALRVSRGEMASLRADVSPRDASRLIRWGRPLIALQMALSLLLLAGALLVVTTLRNLRTGDFGFVREGVVTMRLEPGRAGYAGERRLAYFHDVLDRVRGMQGVRHAALSLGVPVIGAGVDSSFSIEGQPREPDALAFVNEITDGYFAATGTRVLRGRDFGAQDGSGSTRVAIVSDALAQRYFGSGDPVGQRVNVGLLGSLEVVGVVETTKYQSLREVDTPIVYGHAFQGGRLNPIGGLNLVVKTSGSPAVLASSIRRAVAAVGPVPVGKPSILAENIDRTLVKERLIARVLGTFALLAVALAAVGLYGVLAYAVARRTGEIGVRIALGATRGDVLRPVLADAARLVAIGVAIGLPAALGLTRLLSSLLYNVTPTDPRVLGVVVLSLFLVALAAGSIPAWRAARVDPLVALRHG